MREDNKTILGPGTLSIDGEPYYKLDEEQVVYEEPLWPKENPFLKIGGGMQTLSVTCTIAAEAITALARGINNWMASIFRDCPNRRVVHLALHGKKKRTRKKNLRRAIRLAEKEAKR